MLRTQVLTPGSLHAPQEQHIPPHVTATLLLTVPAPKPAQHGIY